MYRSSGGFELALSPLLMGVVGYMVDRWFGTAPVITVVFAVLGLIGVCVKIYFGYRSDMANEEADAPWAKR